MFKIPSLSDVLAPLLGIALAVSVAFAGWQSLRLSWAKTDLAQEQADRAKEAARLARIARDRAEQNSRIQAEHTAATQALADAYEQDRARLADDNARLAADAGGLRQDIERFIAARAGGTDACASSCQRFADRAVTIGHLFGACDRLAEKLAGIAEQRNAEVRVLKRQLAADRLACTSDKGATDGEANR